jgi:hypothetical protein
VNEEKLKKTLSNLMKGVVAKGMLVKRGVGAHNTHRWIKTHKVSSSVVKMAGVGEPRYQGSEPLEKELIVHELLRKDTGLGGGAPATVESTGFTPTFGGVQSRSVMKRVAAQKGLPYPDFDNEKPKEKDRKDK